MYTMRPKTASGAQIPEPSFFSLPKKKTTTDRDVRKHVRQWTSREVHAWLMDTLGDSSIIPEPCPNGRELLKMSLKNLTEMVCRGNRQKGIKIYYQVRCKIQEYQATYQFNDLQHCYESAYPHPMIKQAPRMVFPRCARDKLLLPISSRPRGAKMFSGNSKRYHTSTP